MCPFGQFNEAKYAEAQEAGKIRRPGEPQDPEVMTSLVKAHYINVPMLATCCGVSACYNCIKSMIADQLLAQQKKREKKANQAQEKEAEKEKDKDEEMEKADEKDDKNEEE